MQEAWTLRAGAELWKAFVAEANCPASDTQKALKAVRHALDCARRLRVAAGISEATRKELEAECVQAAEEQVLALRQWGRGRGMRWGADWGTRWGEALPEKGGSLGPTCIAASFKEADSES